jgi:ubiquinone/menaquinone biosynthesis C-methylase UbiE
MTQQISYGPYSAAPAAYYERYFVPAIGAPLAHDLLELAELHPGQRVLDVACGTGVVTRLGAQRVGRGAVTGVDVNPGMLAVARRVAADRAIEWREASAEALPLEDASFDVVLCQMGLQFFPDRERAVREMWRVLKPGGRVVLNVPGPTPPLFAVLEQSLRRHVGHEAAGIIATVFSLHSLEEVSTLLEEAGFTDVLVHSERKALRVARAEDFLWQYVNSTPVGQATKGLEEDQRARFEQEIVARWEPFADDGGLVLDVDVTTATGRKA